MKNPIHTHRSACDQFKRIFNRSVFDFWCPITGFDVIKFDEWMAPPDGTSCEEQVETKYGKAAVAVVLQLMQVRS